MRITNVMTARGRVIQVRMTPKEEDAARRLAKDRDITLSEAIRQLVLEADRGTRRGETSTSTPRTKREA
jgi:hypothetical protein